MKQLNIRNFFIVVLLLSFALSACDGTIPDSLNSNSQNSGVNLSNDNTGLDDSDDDTDDDSDDDIGQGSNDEMDDDSNDDMSDDSNDDETLTALVEAVDGNTVTINGQVFTLDDSYNLDISEYLQAGQTINYRLDDDGNEIKIFIDGIGEVELKFGVSDDGSDHSMDDDDMDDDSNDHDDDYDDDKDEKDDD